MDELIYYFFSEKRAKYTKRFYKNLLNNQANECTRFVIQAKEKHIAKISAKLVNPNTAPKTYWSIISKFLNRSKMPPIPPILAKVNWYLVSK